MGFEMLTKAHECSNLSEFEEMLRLQQVLSPVLTLEIASEAMQAFIVEETPSKSSGSEAKNKQPFNPHRTFADLVATGSFSGSGALSDCFSAAWVVTRIRDLSGACEFVSYLFQCPPYCAKDVIASRIDSSNVDVK